METSEYKVNTVRKEVQEAVGEGWCVNTEMVEFVEIALH